VRTNQIEQYKHITRPIKVGTYVIDVVVGGTTGVITGVATTDEVGMAVVGGTVVVTTEGVGVAVDTTEGATGVGASVVAITEGVATTGGATKINGVWGIF
jgi:hypothetical protein